MDPGMLGFTHRERHKHWKKPICLFHHLGKIFVSIREKQGEKLPWKRSSPSKKHGTARIMRCIGFLMDQGRIILNLPQIPLDNHCIFRIIVHILYIQSLLSYASVS